MKKTFLRILVINIITLLLGGSFLFGQSEVDGCDTLNNISVKIQFSPFVETCCFDVIGLDSLVKRKNCDNIIEGLCEVDEETCCKFFINSNRNGINNPAFYSNFQFGSVTGATWNDFQTAYTFQGGTINSDCPDSGICNVTNFELCGLEYNKLTYEDQNGFRQEIKTTCSVDNCTVETWCGRIDENVIDNHTNGATPISPVAYRVDQHLITFNLSNGQTFSFTDNGPYTSYPNQLIDWAVFMSALTGKNWERRSRGADGNNYTPYGNYIGTDCCAFDPYVISATAETVGGVRDGRVFDLLARKIEGEVVQYEKCLCCDEKSQWQLDGMDIESPDTCQLSRACEFPETIQVQEATCPPEILGPFCHIVPADPENPVQSDIQESGIFFEVIKCEGAYTTSAYTLPDPEAEPVPFNYNTGFIGDCSTLVPVEEPVEPAPEQCYPQNYFITENVTNTLWNREWVIGPRPSSFNSIEEALVFLDSTFTDGTPDFESDWNGLNVNDSFNYPDSSDIQIIRGYIKVDRPMKIRFASTSEGYFGFSIGVCCSEKIKEIEGGYLEGTHNPTNEYDLPIGTHSVYFENVDSWSNSSKTFYYSLDDGSTWIADNTPPFVQISRMKPVQTLFKGWFCPDGNVWDAEKENIIDLDDPLISCERIVCEKKTKVVTVECCEIDPCLGITYEKEIIEGQFDCTISNLRTDTTRSYICVDGIKTIDIEETNEVIIPTGCFDVPQIKVASNEDTGTVGWNSGYYTSADDNCPIYGDFEACATVDYQDPSKLFIWNLSSTPNSFWGEYSVYFYDYENGTGTISRDWIRPYQLGGGGYVTGWQDYTEITTSIDVCIERVGSTITYKADGVTFYTGVANYLGPVYINYTPYFHPTSIWSTGTHLFSSKICETNGGVNSRSSRRLNIRMNEIYLTPEEELETLPEFFMYLDGKIKWNEFKKEIKKLGLNLNKKSIEKIGEKYSK